MAVWSGRREAYRRLVEITPQLHASSTTVPLPVALRAPFTFKKLIGTFNAEVGSRGAGTRYTAQWPCLVHLWRALRVHIGGYGRARPECMLPHPDSPKAPLIHFVLS